MSKADNTFEYDEESSVQFIQSNMPEKLQGQLSDDEINYLVDLIYEYYEYKGFLKDDAEDNIEIDEEELIAYVLENSNKDNVKEFTQEQVEAVIEGELSFYDSLDEDESFYQDFIDADLEDEDDDDDDDFDLDDDDDDDEFDDEDFDDEDFDDEDFDDDDFDDDDFDDEDFEDEDYDEEEDDEFKK